MRFRVRVRVSGLMLWLLGPWGPLGPYEPPVGLGPAQDPKNMRIGVTTVRFRVRVRVRG